MEIEIRKLKEDDLDDLYRLGLEQFKGEFWFTKKFIKNTMRPPGVDFVACDKGKLVGVILAENLDKPKNWIFYFIVDKKYRRKGIGKMLLDAVQEKCSRDFPLLFVDVGVNDIEANNFYQKNGFLKQAQINDWFGIGEPGIIYSKKLI